MRRTTKWSGGSGRAWRLATMVIVAPVAAGCYTFTPIPVEPTPVGENVRVYVTRTGAPEVLTVAEEVGAVPEIRGRVEGEESGSLLLRTPVRSETATRALDIGQLVRVPTGEIVAMERQSFSTGRTVALLAGGIGAAAFVLYVIIDSGRGDNGVDTPDPDLFVGGLRGLRIPIGW